MLKVLLLLLIVPGIVKAEPVEITELYWQYVKIKDVGAWRNPYYPGKSDWDFVAETGYETIIYKYLFWQNRFHFAMDKSQVRHAGWEYYLGFKINNHVRVFKYHHSEHALESKPKGKFPVFDGYGIRLDFIGGK